MDSNSELDRRSTKSHDSGANLEKCISRGPDIGLVNIKQQTKHKNVAKESIFRRCYSRRRSRFRRNLEV